MTGPFPTAPLRTVRASFRAYGSPVAGLSGGRVGVPLPKQDTTIAEPHPRHLASLAPYRPGPPAPLRPVTGFPGLRLLRGLRRPGGRPPRVDLVLHRLGSVHGLDRPLIPTLELIARCPTCGPRDPVRNRTPSCGATLASVVAGLEMGRPGLDFRQSSFGLAVRVLRGKSAAGGGVPRFSGGLWSPWPRRLRVSRMTQGTLARVPSFLEMPCRPFTTHPDSQ